MREGLAIFSALQQPDFLENRALQLQVFKQLEKDFVMSGETYEVNEELQLKDWYMQLSQKLRELLIAGDVRALLYRIDVSEKKIRQIANLSLDDLAILVLKRELEKVLLRARFS